MVRAFPNYPVLADYKTMDSGGKNVHRTKAQGGHVMTVCANAPDETVQAAVAASQGNRYHGRGRYDRREATGGPCPAVRGVGRHMIYLHYGADQRAAMPRKIRLNGSTKCSRPCRFPSASACFGVEDAVRAVSARRRRSSRSAIR